MANTTNLNLVKPAGTDKALVSVLNSNSDKIDAFAGTTNQALSNLDTPTRITDNSSLSVVKTNIQNVVNNMGTANVRVIILAITANFNQFSGGDWITTIYKTSNNYFSGIATSYNSTKDMIYFQCLNGTWTFDSFARKSDMTVQNVSYTYNAANAEEQSGETFVKRIGNTIFFNLSFISKVSSGNASPVLTYDSALNALSGNGYVFAYNMTDGVWNRGYATSRVINIFNLVSGKHYLVSLTLPLS